jgi:hypothetical protein
MKNFLKAAVLSVLMVAMPMTKSHAIVGVATGNAPLALAGLASPAVGYGMVFVGAETGMCHEFACLNFFAFGILAGIVMLDEEGSSLTFKEISKETANEFNISLKEMNTYNNELDEVNAVFEEVTSQLDADSTIEDSEALWSEYGEYLSPQTLKVMKTLK